jgi:predicted dehydrogenase
MKIGLIGCGGRGCRDTVNCVKSTDEVQLWAMGDLFREQRNPGRTIGVNSAYQRLQKKIPDKMNVPEKRRFAGWNAYEKVLETDVDLVLLTTPPHFRPIQARAAIEAGKHVFMEKPVAVDPWGVRHIIKTGKMAKKKGLAMMAGTQMRHSPEYEQVMKRIHRGDIGEVVGGQIYFCVGGLWVRHRKSDMSDIEWQVRNWYYFDWMSGDHIVEQHVHKIDIMNWVFGGPPRKAFASGGRQVRTGEEKGNIYDHFSVEYEFENGARVQSMCRQIPGTSHRGGENFVGTKGKAVSTGFYGLKLVGENPYKHKGGLRQPAVREHKDLISSIREGEPLNDARTVAESTLTAILGRMSAYTGKALSWNWIMNESELRLGPKQYGFGDFEPRPVAMPGERKLV